jgi:hypothetical protein
MVAAFLPPPAYVQWNPERREADAAQTDKIEAQAAEISKLRKLVVEMQAGLLKLQARDELVAQR